MNMKKLKHYIIIFIVFFSWTGIVNASILINEVELAPTEERFIELYNNGDFSVDLTNWYIQRKTATGSSFGSLVSKTYFDGVNIGVDSYLLISKTSLYNPDILVDNLTLTESNTIQIKNSNREIVDVYNWGSITDGQSSQKMSSGDWSILSPTPGIANEVIENVVSGNSNIGGGVASNSNNTNQVDSTTRTIKSKIIIPKIIFAGIPFIINADINTNKNEELNRGLYKWNFGDGGIKELKDSNPFEYTYYYPGEYILLLDYYEHTYNNKIDSSSRARVKVIIPEVFISSVGPKEDPYIEIENKSKYEMQISNWIIQAGVKQFLIPNGTILLPNRKLKFSPRVTNFIGSDLSYILLTSSNRNLMATYPSKANLVINKKVIRPKTINSRTSTIKNTKENTSIIDLNELSASAGKIKTPTSYTTYSYFGFGIIILLGIASIFLIKKKNYNHDELEDRIRAEDMTIIE